MRDPAFAQAIASLRAARTYLAMATPALGDDSASEVRYLIRRLEDLLPLAERENRGERYVCRCCGVDSFRPFGPDKTICGPCHNGIHIEHEPNHNADLPGCHKHRRFGKSELQSQ